MSRFLGAIHGVAPEESVSVFILKHKLGEIPLDSVVLTVEKLKSLGVFTFDEGGVGNTGNARGYFRMTSIAERLFEIIQESEIFDKPSL